MFSSIVIDKIAGIYRKMPPKELSKQIFLIKCLLY